MGRTPCVPPVVTPSSVPESFERDMGCTKVQLVWSLRAALPGATLLVDTDRAGASAVFDDGSLHLSWNALPPRQIALLEIPRTLVTFRYERMGPERRQAVQRRFDMEYQRGGG